MIHGLGYKTEVVENPKAKSASTAGTWMKAPVPKDAPKFFVEAMRRAQQRKRPAVIDFWAKWCVPCKKLKKRTMEHPDVVEVLDSMEVIFVELDEHPSLAKAYGVKSIPDVFFVDPDGNVIDRLRKFEPAAPFLKRLKNFHTKPKNGIVK